MSKTLITITSLTALGLAGYFVWKKGLLNKSEDEDADSLSSKKKKKKSDSDEDIEDDDETNELDIDTEESADDLEEAADLAEEAADAEDEEMELSKKEERKLRREERKAKRKERKDARKAKRKNRKTEKKKDRKEKKKERKEKAKKNLDKAKQQAEKAKETVAKIAEAPKVAVQQAAQKVQQTVQNVGSKLKDAGKKLFGKRRFAFEGNDELFNAFSYFMENENFNSNNMKDVIVLRGQTRKHIEGKNFKYNDGGNAILSNGMKVMKGDFKVVDQVAGFDGEDFNADGMKDVIVLRGQTRKHIEGKNFKYNDGGNAILSNGMKVMKGDFKVVDQIAGFDGEDFDGEDFDGYEYADGTREIRWGCNKNKQKNFDSDFSDFF